ncbi:MAG TPA: UDP-N-acetylmuramoyl-L-alanine--D-glutamate ligase [Rhodocyclaceae bacterium]|nr:UDP-N-acetylmuramoyl-L-alanine--D-glutamate ligase [Rhodocyclaceae bacterium]
MLEGKHVLVLGLGESGLACVRWCARNGARVRVADTRATPPGRADLHRLERDFADFALSGIEFVGGEFDKTLLNGINLLVVSPGLSSRSLLAIHARAAGIPVVGEIELFAQALRTLAAPSAPAPILAITGTNGKTTTTALTGHLLRATGKTVGVAGNISPAALDALMDFQDEGALPDVWVLELSSFQLETTDSLHAVAATVLNVSDDHLDRHIDLNEYAEVKARIFGSGSGVGGGAQVLNRQDERVKAMALPGRRLLTFGLDAPAAADDFGVRLNRGAPWLVQGERFLLPLSDLPIKGLHNAANAMAALALCSALGFPAPALLPALRNFRGLPHRVERVLEHDGVVWYDDSKGTNVGATVAALQAGLPQGDGKVVVLLGGDGKGQDFSPLQAAVAAHARAVVLYGRDAPLIESCLRACGVTIEYAVDMNDAARRARALARPGDVVLLSPACASFDMFRNYEHRAEVFIAAAHAATSDASSCAPTNAVQKSNLR